MFYKKRKRKGEDVSPYFFLHSKACTMQPIHVKGEKMRKEEDQGEFSPFGERGS